MILLSAFISFTGCKKNHETKEETVSVEGKWKMQSHTFNYFDGSDKVVFTSSAPELYDVILSKTQITYQFPSDTVAIPYKIYKQGDKSMLQTEGVPRDLELRLTGSEMIWYDQTTDPKECNYYEGGTLKQAAKMTGTFVFKKAN